MANPSGRRAKALTRPDFSFERHLLATGEHVIAGIDEAGRGPLAGPVTAAAVVLTESHLAIGLDDSKRLSEAEREELYARLTGDPEIEWACAVVEVEEIDRLNILRAAHEAMRRAVLALARRPTHVLIDGLPVRPFPIAQTALVKGDSRSYSIAAASVLAKVTRDRMMIEFHALYPHYGFDQHKGYGTALHLEALRRHGACPIHRQTFAPVRSYQGELFS